MAIVVQSSFFGQDKYIADSRTKLAELYDQNPDIAESEKKVVLEYWQAYDGLPEILSEKLDDFISWFYRATSPETITRCFRALKSEGIIKATDKTERRRREMERKYRGTGVMWRGVMAFSGTNKVCAQCVHECKQFDDVTLMNCPKFQSTQTDKPQPYKRKKSSRIKIYGGKHGR